MKPKTRATKRPNAASALLAASRASGRKGKGPTAGSWKPGQSGNPNGAPRRGTSWVELFKTYGDMTGTEAAERSRLMADDLAAVGNSMTLKEAVVLAAYRALIYDTPPSLLGQVIDRVEGDGPQPGDSALEEWARAHGVDPAQLRAAVRAAVDGVLAQTAKGEQSA